MHNASLGEVADFINGYAFKPSDWNGSGKKIIRIQNLTDNSKPFNLTNTKIPEKYYVRKGNILVSWSATLDIFEWTYDETALLNQHIFKVEIKDDIIDKQYFKYILKNVIQSMLKYSHGSTMKHIVRGDFLKTRIPLPPLPEQKRIAEILDKADSLRQRRKESIALLDEFLRSVFLDMFGDPVRNEKGWEKKTFDNLIEIERNQINPDAIQDETIYIDLESIQKETGKIINYRKVQNGFIQSSKFKFTTNHLLYGKLRPYLNKVALPSFSGVCSTDILPILPKENISNKYFISQLMRQSYFVNYMNEKSSGANLPRVNVQTIYGFKSIIPPLKLQTQFSKIVEQIEATKAKMEESLKEMDNQFNGLLQRVFKEN